METTTLACRPDTISLIHIRNPFDPYGSRSYHVMPYQHGVSPQEYLKDLLAGDDQEYAISINGKILPFEAIHQTIVQPGEQIVACPVLEGGNTGKMVLRIVAMVVVMIIAAVTMNLWAEPIIVGWGITYGAVAGMAIALIGSVLVNALIPMPKPEAPDVSGVGTVSATYGWNGVRMLAAQGLPIGVVYGTHKVGGNVISRYVNTLDNKQYLNMLISLGEGPVTSIEDVKVNNNPASGFYGLVTETRLGTNNQTIIPNFSDIYTETAVSVEVPVGDTVVRTTTGDGIQALEVDLLFPQGIWGVTETGELITYTASFEVKYRVHPAGSWVLFPNQPVTITVANRESLRYVYRVDNLSPEMYDVAVRSISGGNPNPYQMATLGWTSFREIIYDDLAYPNTALLGIKALATEQLSGSDPQITCMVTRSGVDVWTGSQWVTKFADNPAWVVYDMLRHPRYGGGISEARIDYPSFQAWADWCDQLVDDGDGGTEPRCTFNGVLDAEGALWESILQVGTTARGIPIQQGTKIYAYFEQAGTPEQLFSVGNVKEGSLKITYLPLQDRATEVEVTFLDENRNYDRNAISVTTDDGLTSTGVSRKTSFPMNGITRDSQAFREAKWRLLLNQYLLKTVQFDVDVDALAARVGDLIYLQHDVPQWGQGGRVVSSTSNTITLDQDLTVVEGKSYRVMVRLANDTLLERSIVVPVGGYTGPTFQVSSIWGAELPALYNVYCFGEVNLDRQEFRLVSVERKQELVFTLTAVNYDPRVYADSTPVPPGTVVFPIPPELFPPAVTNLAANVRWAIKDGGAAIPLLDLTWTIPGSVTTGEYQGVTYQVYVSTNGGLTWTLKTATTGGGCTLSDLSIDVLYRIAIVSRSAAGMCTPIGTAPYIDFTIGGRDIVPDPPTDVTSFAGIQCVVLRWTNPVMKDLAAVEVYRSTTNNSGNAVYVGESTGLSYLDGQLTTATPYYYWLKTRNTSDVKSAFHAGVNNGVVQTPIAVAAGDIGAGAITEVKIADDAITAPKIAANVIDSSHLRTDTAVISVAAQIANAVIGNAHVNDLSADKLSAGTLAAARLSTSVAYITAYAQMADAVITNAHIANLQVDNAKIANLTLATGKIQDNAVSQVLQARTDASYEMVCLIAYDWTTWTIQENTITTTGGPITAVCAFTMSCTTTNPTGGWTNYRYSLWRGGTQLIERTGTIDDDSWVNIVLPLMDQPSAGTYTYYLKVSGKEGVGEGHLFASVRVLQLLESKK